MHPPTAARALLRRRSDYARRVASRLRREISSRQTGTADIVGVRRNFDHMTMTVATPTPAELRAVLVSSAVHRSRGIAVPMERLDADFAVVTLDADLLSAAETDHTRLEIRGRVRRWRLGRTAAVSRPPVTMPLTPLRTSSDVIVSTRLTSSRDEAVLHHLNWSV